MENKENIENERIDNISKPDENATTAEPTRKNFINEGNEMKRKEEKKGIWSKIKGMVGKKKKDESGNGKEGETKNNIGNKETKQ
ncbi:hypothetical protein CWI39_0372p0020 [Hamiltosporidium magnivora]|uniref:Uncharacterized protein n=1 Tax=Hamiltosporidium magnivora TaxID=148818 RepID=A0A4Q9LHX3_9MICR|nr:hypothetical protein CWI39_0372p0020 [Hamiltosporidium magnivora]